MAWLPHGRKKTPKCIIVEVLGVRRSVRRHSVSLYLTRIASLLASLGRTYVMLHNLRLLQLRLLNDDGYYDDDGLQVNDVQLQSMCVCIRALRARVKDRTRCCNKVVGLDKI